MPDFELASIRSFLHFLIPALFYCYKRKLSRIRREKWIWTFFYCFFFNIFNVTNYLAVNYIAAGVASCIRRFVKAGRPNLFEVFVNNATMSMLTYLLTSCFSYVYASTFSILQTFIFQTF